MIHGPKKWIGRHAQALIITFSCSIIITYLGCVCGWDWNGLLYFLYPETLIKALMLLCAYLAWKSYRKENTATAICILFSTATVILPVALENDRYEMLLEFCWCLLPVLVVVPVNKGVRKFLRNRKAVCCIDMTVIVLLAALLFLMTKDFYIPVLWLMQGLIWTGVFCFADGAEKMKRNTKIAWFGSLLLFVCFTFMEVSYLLPGSIWWEVRRRYWNEVIYLAWPMILLVFWKMLDNYIAKEIRYYVQKISLIYFTVILLAIYAITRLDLNGAVSCFVYDISKLLFCLFLSELVLWRKLYKKQKAVGSRIRSALFLLLINAGAFATLFLQNKRLREIMRYLSGFLRGSGPADWIIYRKTVFCAVLANDTSVLDSLYKGEAYWKALSRHGIADIWFDVGSLPVFLMVFFAVALVILLWNWNQENSIFNQYAKYLTAGYMLKMGLAVLLQVNLICSIYIEFPLTGQDIAEGVVLGLLLFAGGKRDVIQKEYFYFEA